MRQHALLAAAALMLLASGRPGLSQSVYRTDTVVVAATRGEPSLFGMSAAHGGSSVAGVRGGTGYEQLLESRDVLSSLRADTTVKRNRGLGAVIGGGIRLLIGGVIGYEKGDPRAPPDQAVLAAIYGGAAALVGAIIGAIYGPRVP